MKFKNLDKSYTEQVAEQTKWGNAGPIRRLRRESKLRDQIRRDRKFGDDPINEYEERGDRRWN